METFYPGCPEEVLFYNTIRDLKKFKRNIILIGGWLPWIYSKYLWNKDRIQVFKTSDIDFTLTAEKLKSKKNIRETLESKKYYKKIQMDDEFYFCIEDDVLSMKIDFLKSPYSDDAQIQSVIGSRINTNKIEYMDIMIKPENHIDIKPLDIFVIKPSLYFYTKGLTFTSRSINSYKYVKDMWSLYFILTEMPSKEQESFQREILEYFHEGEEYFQFFQQNIEGYFLDENAEGVLKLSDFLKDHFPKELIKKQITGLFNDFLQRLYKGMEKNFNTL